MKSWGLAVAAIAAAAVMAGGGPARAQPSEPAAAAALEAAIAQHETGQWEAAAAGLTELLDSGDLPLRQRSRARRVLAEAYVSLRRDPEAVAVYRDLLREDHTFDMGALGPEPHARLLGTFAQALLDVRAEELRQQEEELLRTSRLGAMARSLVLPGWGQYYQGFRGRSYTILAGAGAAVAWAALSHGAYTKRRDEYDQAAAGADFDRLYDRYRRASDMADVTLYVAGAVWAANALDALVTGPNLGRVRSPAVQARVEPDGTLRLACVHRF